jgi:hypothetical protein
VCCILRVVIYWAGLFIGLVCLWEFALFGNVVGTFWPGLVLNLNVINCFIVYRLLL